MPVVRATDEDLGTGYLHKVLPETWNNIAWAVQNAIEVLKEQALAMRRLIEEVKLYSVNANVVHTRATAETDEKNTLEFAKMTKVIDDLDDNTKIREKETRIEINRHMDGIEAKLQRQVNELDAQLARAELKLDQVETFAVTKEYIDKETLEIREDYIERTK